MDLLIRHGRVITMDAERRILTDGAIAITDGRITAVGPDSEVAAGSGTTPTLPMTRSACSGLPLASPKAFIEILKGLLPELKALKESVARTKESACMLSRSATESKESSNKLTVPTPTVTALLSPSPNRSS